jgi:hypothetical protein
MLDTYLLYLVLKFNLMKINLERCLFNVYFAVGSGMTCCEPVLSIREKWRLRRPFTSHFRRWQEYVERDII